MSAAAPANPATTLTVIEAGGRGPVVPWTALRRHGELLAFLAWRDIRVRYRQTVLGVSWALVEPLAGAALYTLLFHHLAGISAGAVPYALSCFAAVLIWTFFGRSLRAVMVSLVANSGLITKAYFPRLILPLAALGASTIDLLCVLPSYGLLAGYYRVWPGWPVLTLPLWAILAALAALGIGLTLASLNVRFRDVSAASTFLVQAWMLATPVVYPLSLIPPAWRSWYALNPMVAVVEGTRWALLPNYTLDPLLLLPGLAVTLICLAVGLTVFSRTEHRFADVI